MRNINILHQVVKELDKGICRCPDCDKSLGWDDVDTIDDDEGCMLEIFCLDCIEYDEGILWSVDWSDEDEEDYDEYENDEDRFTDPDYVIDHIDEACGWG